MRVLVTGGCGYIGSLAVKKLIESNHDVIVVDDLSTGSVDAILNCDIVLEKCDIRDYDLLLEVFRKHKIDFVMDFAAKLIVEEGEENPDLYYDVNVVGLKNVLKCMIETNVKKIIFSSTAAVYGLLDKKSELIYEEDPTIPSNVYGNTKLIGETLIKDYAQKYDLEFIIFRYFNVVGNVKYGYSLESLTTVVPVIINAANTGKEMVINGSDYNTIDGTTIRDFIHVEDLVSAHIIACENLNSSNKGIYNLSVGNGTSVLELIKFSSNKLNKQINYKFGPRRIGDPIISAASNAKFKKNFFWDIKYTNIGDMILETSKAWDDYTNSLK